MCGNKGQFGFTSFGDFNKYRSPYWRFKIWYLCFYVGYPIMLAFCFIYAFANPDDADCWYGEIKSLTEADKTDELGDTEENQLVETYVPCDITKNKQDLED